MNRKNTSSAAWKMRASEKPFRRKALNVEHLCSPPSQGKNILVTFPFIEPVRFTRSEQKVDYLSVLAMGIALKEVPQELVVNVVVVLYLGRFHKRSEQPWAAVCCCLLQLRIATLYIFT